MLNKHSPIPLYYQLAEQLKEQIHLGEFGAGERIPAERELAQQMGVSRMTARQAVAYLVSEGLLDAKPGVGTFVTAPKLIHNPLHLLGFTEEVMGQGGIARSQVLEQGIVHPPRRVAAGLALSTTASVVKVTRMRFSDDLPLLLETSFLPAALCRGLAEEALATQSLYTLLEQRYQLRLEWARQTIEATVANAYEANLFAIALGAPMILLQGVAYTTHDRPIEYFKAIYRGDRFTFELESRRNSLESNFHPVVSNQPALTPVLHSVGT